VAPIGRADPVAYLHGSCCRPAAPQRRGAVDAHALAHIHELFSKLQGCQPNFCECSTCCRGEPHVHLGSDRTQTAAAPMC
jgi:hypothetical protein